VAKGGPKIVVYIPVADEQKLRERGHDPAVWVRGLVKHALQKL
jgi:hypothetical protein